MYPYALEIEQLEKVYNNGVVALKKINLKIKDGDFFALLGPNGAGKSTLISIIASLVNKTAGKIKIFGQEVHPAHCAVKAYLGIVPQEFNFNVFEKVEQILLNQAGYFGVPRATAMPLVEEYLKKLGLLEKRYYPALSLSGGMKRRLMLARALIHKPKLLILDEPTAGVDIELRRSLWDFIKEINQQGTTIILTTHYLEEAENLCKNIAIINHGEIVIDLALKDFLKQLDKEYFVLSLKNPLDPQITLPLIPGCPYKIIDPLTLEVEIPKNTALNPFFSLLTTQNIEVLSIKSKATRLEELFFRLIQDKQGKPDPSDNP
jgi:ABC-2 type transport system ATP-binding protein